MEPVIRNFEGNQNLLLRPGDSVSTYVRLYVRCVPGESTPDHVHPCERRAFITEGSGVLIRGGKEHPITAGDAPLIPPNVRRQLKNTGSMPVIRVTVNPIESVRAGAGG